jgi:hypothetical protein
MVRGEIPRRGIPVGPFETPTRRLFSSHLAQALKEHLMKTIAQKNRKEQPAQGQADTAKSIPILGANLKGELRDIAIDLVGEPGGKPDRLAREGDEEACDRLARSMGEVGQLQPIMVEDIGGGKYVRLWPPPASRGKEAGMAHDPRQRG